MKRIVFLLFLIFPVSAYSAAKVQSLTATYIPSEIGLETEVTLTYKFIKAGGLQVAMSASSRKHGSGAYWWKGTRYTAEELGSAAFWQSAARPRPKAPSHNLNSKTLKRPSRSGSTRLHSSG